MLDPVPSVPVTGREPVAGLTLPQAPYALGPSLFISLTPMAKKSTAKKSAGKKPAPQKRAAKAPKYVYTWGNGKADGNGGMKPLLGGKGANLAEMTRIGLPVPPGFTITTEVCTYYYAHKRTYPKELQAQMQAGVANMEKIMGTKFGATEGTPLLVAVRSGARDSMPGMESRAPERTATRSGVPSVAPNFVPMMRSMFFTPASICTWREAG